MGGEFSRDEKSAVCKCHETLLQNSAAHNCYESFPPTHTSLLLFVREIIHPQIWRRTHCGLCLSALIYNFMALAIVTWLWGRMSWRRVISILVLVHGPVLRRRISFHWLMSRCCCFSLEWITLVSCSRRGPSARIHLKQNQLGPHQLIRICILHFVLICFSFCCS